MSLGEPRQGVRLYRAPFFEIFKGCHATAKSLILTVFIKLVNRLSVPLLDCGTFVSFEIMYCVAFSKSHSMSLLFAFMSMSSSLLSIVYIYTYSS